MQNLILLTIALHYGIFHASATQSNPETLHSLIVQPIVQTNIDKNLIDKTMQKIIEWNQHNIVCIVILLEEWQIYGVNWVSFYTSNPSTSNFSVDECFSQKNRLKSKNILAQYPDIEKSAREELEKPNNNKKKLLTAVNVKTKVFITDENSTSLKNAALKCGTTPWNMYCALRNDLADHIYYVYKNYAVIYNWFANIWNQELDKQKLLRLPEEGKLQKNIKESLNVIISVLENNSCLQKMINTIANSVNKKITIDDFYKHILLSFKETFDSMISKFTTKLDNAFLISITKSDNLEKFSDPVNANLNIEIDKEQLKTEVKKQLPQACIKYINLDKAIEKTFQMLPKTALQSSKEEFSQSSLEEATKKIINDIVPIIKSEDDGSNKKPN